MRYYKLIENDKLVAIGTGYDGAEITEDEYTELLAVIREKAALVEKLYNGEITIENVPVEWQEEIQRRVDERILLEGAADQQDISGDELLSMLSEVL